MGGQGKTAEKFRKEADQATLAAAEVVRRGEAVLRRAHEVAHAIEERIRRTTAGGRDSRSNP
jgi:hypothetical protein